MACSCPHCATPTCSTHWHPCRDQAPAHAGRRSQIPASELSGYTISLSNFGMFAGRYATPVVVPPTVAIIGAGKLSHDVVAVMGGIEVHRRMPLSHHLRPSRRHGR
jgi:pyruvate/2-oxoglutarate dehydrogenase complex dihydrolipoamide acyltransferase (E2) component